jgi:hypothetical protein
LRGDAGLTSTPRIAGLWDARIVTANQVEIPFRFEIVQSANRVQGFFFEGDRKVGSTSGSFQNGALTRDPEDLRRRGTPMGRWNGGRLAMSHFAGERIRIFRAAWCSSSSGAAGARTAWTKPRFLVEFYKQFQRIGSHVGR